VEYGAQNCLTDIYVNLLKISSWPYNILSTFSKGIQELIPDFLTRNSFLVLPKVD
jgi:hypothetical protein